MLKSRLQLTKLLTLPGIHLQCTVSMYLFDEYYEILMSKLAEYIDDDA